MTSLLTVYTDTLRRLDRHDCVGGHGFYHQVPVSILHWVVELSPERVLISPGNRHNHFLRQGFSVTALAVLELGTPRDLPASALKLRCAPPPLGSITV